MIQVKTFFAHNELRNFSYLLYEDVTGEAWVIDPYEASPLIKYIRDEALSLKGILNTHQHFDHVRGNVPLMEAFRAPVRKLVNAEKVSLGSEVMLESLDTPGHTLDHQVFILKAMGRPWGLFSGDTLFNAGVGNCRNGGDVDLLFKTTMNLMAALPGETLLYPGHDYAQRNLEFALTVEPENEFIMERLREVKGHDVDGRGAVELKTERKVNPFLRLHSEELRKGLIKERNFLVESPEIERNLFVQLRTLRDQW